MCPFFVWQNNSILFTEYDANILHLYRINICDSEILINHVWDIKCLVQLLCQNDAAKAKKCPLQPCNDAFDERAIFHLGYVCHFRWSIPDISMFS